MVNRAVKREDLGGTESDASPGCVAILRQVQERFLLF